MSPTLSCLEVINLEFILRLKISAMIGCLWTRVRKQPITALYCESETVLEFYHLDAWYLALNLPCIIEFIERGEKQYINIFSNIGAFIASFILEMNSLSGVHERMNVTCSVLRGGGGG